MFRLLISSSDAVARVLQFEFNWTKRFLITTLDYVKYLKEQKLRKAILVFWSNPEKANTIYTNKKKHKLNVNDKYV